MKNLVIALVVSFSVPSFAASFLEDIIDLTAGFYSMGLSLRMREMSEAELKAKYTKMLSEKSLELANDANKKKAELLTKYILETENAKYSRETLLKTIEESLDFIQAFRNEYKIYFENKLEMAYQIEQLIQNLGLQIENIQTLNEILLLVSSDIKMQKKNTNMTVPLIVANMDKIVRDLGLTQKQMMQISIHLSDQNSIQDMVRELTLSELQLSSFRASLKAQITGFELAIKARENMLKELQ